jgi:hypothetical protein
VVREARAKKEDGNRRKAVRRREGSKIESRTCCCDDDDTTELRRSGIRVGGSGGGEWIIVCGMFRFVAAGSERAKKGLASIPWETLGNANVIRKRLQ